MKSIRRHRHNKGDGGIVSRIKRDYIQYTFYPDEIQLAIKQLRNERSKKQKELQKTENQRKNLLNLPFYLDRLINDFTMKTVHIQEKQNEIVALYEDQKILIELKEALLDFDSSSFNFVMNISDERHNEKLKQINSNLMKNLQSLNQTYQSILHMKIENIVDKIQETEKTIKNNQTSNIISDLSTQIKNMKIELENIDKNIKQKLELEKKMLISRSRKKKQKNEKP